MFFLDKPEPDQKLRTRRRRRPWTIPVPPAWRHDEPLEGGVVLNEMRSPLGALLFQRFRDAHLWAGTPPDDRAGLLHHAGGACSCAALAEVKVPEEIRAAVRVLASVSHDGRMSAARVADACAEMAEWADGSGHGGTAAAFMELAATLLPDDAERSYAAAQVARARADCQWASQWFARSVGLARRQKEWSIYATVYLSWGLMEEGQGRREQARKYFVRAWRKARDHRLRELGAAAQHNLLMLCVFDGTFEQAQQHATAAFELYGETNERLPRLANDIAALWGARGYWSLAGSIYEAVWPLMDQCADRVAVLANFGRSAAECGRMKQYLAACDEVSRHEHAAPAMYPYALIELAEGAHALRKQHLVRNLIAQAILAARQRGDVRGINAAEAMQCRVQQGSPAPRDIAPPPALSCFTSRVIDCLTALREKRQPGVLDD